ncbi:MAG: hypothetical protein ACRC62_08780 [Microcoleus sp.]
MPKLYCLQLVWERHIAFAYQKGSSDSEARSTRNDMVIDRHKIL